MSIMIRAMSNTEKVLTHDEAAKLQKIIEKSTLAEVAEEFQVSINTLRAVAGRLPARRGTILLVRTKLGERRE